MTRPSLRLLLAILVSSTVAGNLQRKTSEPFKPHAQSPSSRRAASLLFLQPASGNLEYATLVSPLPVPTPNWANQSLSPELSAACNVGLAILSPRPPTISN